MISYHPDDPSFFLLGYDFESSLERKYRYSGVTPYTFAQSISNPAKYDIFRTLIGKPPMTAADISKRLHLSKNALTYNLKEMQESGMLIVDHVKGLTFYYKLDYDYLHPRPRRTPYPSREFTRTGFYTPTANIASHGNFKT